MSDLDWTDSGTPRSRRFNDIYYSDTDGLAESRFTFIGGCNLPAAWSGTRLFVVGETGFGTGLNFLATLAAWRTNRRPGQRLHYVAVEAHPLTAPQLARAHDRFPDIRAASKSLLERYPARLPQAGYRRLHLDADRVTLDLLIGEAGDVLSELEARVDTWFLDGFAPARNPAMWRQEVLNELARLSAPGARFATFTAAGKVRRGLLAAGFEADKAPGFGSKRERLVGRFMGDRRTRLPDWAATARVDEPVALSGAGIAGQSLARSLQRRDRDFSWQRPSAAGASSLPRALVMPRLSADRSLAGRFYSQAAAYAREQYLDQGCWHASGALQLAETAETAERYSRMAETWQEASFVDQTGAFHGGLLAEWSGLWLADAGLVDPPTMPGADGETGDEAIRLWAIGAGTADLPLASVLPLEAYRGQLTLIAPGSPLDQIPTTVICGHYLTPRLDAMQSLGATFDRIAWDALDDTVREDDHQRNLAALATLGYSGTAPSVSGGWAGIRVALPDRLPAVGPVPDRAAFLERFAGLRTGQEHAKVSPLTTMNWVLTGLGARGFTAAPLCAELLVSQLLGEPWPFPRSVALALHPARFLVRAMKRGSL